MANEKRARFNSLGGLVEDNPLTSGATTLTSAGLIPMGVIDSTNHAVVVIDPDGIEGAPEIAYVTTHAASAGSATVLRAQEGTVAIQRSQGIPWVHSATIKDFDGSGGGTGLIGLTSYNPVAATVVANNSLTFADVDATNLVVAFTAPPSGKVLVRLSAAANADNGGAQVCMWNLRSGSSDLAGTSVWVTGLSQSWLGASRSIPMTGLTPGTSYSYKWGQAATATGGAGARTQYGGAVGPAVMEVWAVNL